ncbi:MAG: prepilin peptidase [Alphaproteobacteria bacterium]|nr:prepilin peptidase [Alphaproteobacteria bacterium]
MLLESFWIWMMTGALIGLVFGSFVTMLSYRLPRNMSTISPSSHCPKCKANLKPIDLIPVFSWVFSGGKCRYCHNPISVRYPIIEIVTAVLCAIAFVITGFSFSLVLALMIIVAGVTAATIRLEKWRKK